MAVETTIRLVPKAPRNLVHARKTLRPNLKKSLHEVGKLLKTQIKYNVSGVILNRITGDLHRSVYFRVNGQDMTLQVGAAAPYAMYLETSTRIRPHKRKFLSRSIDEKREEVRKIFKRSVRRSFTKFGW